MRKVRSVENSLRCCKEIRAARLKYGEEIHRKARAMKGMQKFEWAEDA